MSPLTCKDAQFLISLSLDGESGSAGDVLRLEEHLRACASCREARQLDLGLDGRLRSALRSGPELSRGLASSVLEAYRADPQPVALDPGRRRRFPVRLQAVAAAALFAGSVWLGWHLFPGRGVLPRPGEVPVADRATLEDGRSPFNVRLEERREEFQIVRDAEGRPVRRRVERVRSWDVPDGKQEAPGEANQVRLERTSTTDVKLVSWPYQ